MTFSNKISFAPTKATFYRGFSGYYLYLEETPKGCGTVTYEGKVSDAEADLVIKALVTKSKVTLAHEERTKNNKKLNGIKEICQRDYAEKVTVPGSNYGLEFSEQFKSITLWPRTDGTAFGLLRGARKATGRMNVPFIQKALKSLGDTFNFKGIETSTKYGPSLKITSGIIEPELPELIITESDFEPAVDYVPPVDARWIPDGSDLLAGWDPKTSPPEVETPPKSLKRLLEMPTSNAKRHAPEIPELFCDFTEL